MLSLLPVLSSHALLHGMYERFVNAGQDAARRSLVQGLVQELHEELMIYKDGQGRWCAM